MKTSQLYLAVVEITSNCNLNCKHCYAFFNKSKVIGIEDFKSICAQLNSLGTDIITISGGEPMILGSKIKEYVTIANFFFNVVNLTTNGTLITSMNVKYLKSFNCVQVSIDGPCKIHDHIRGTGNFKKAIKSIKMLKLNNIHCSIMTTVSNFNINFLKDVYYIARDLNVPLGFERITNVGRGKNFYSLSKSNTKKLINCAQELKIESSDPLCTVNNQLKREYLLKNKIIAGCMAGNLVVAIDADLNVLPCARLRIPLGNLKNSTLENILKNSKVVKQLKNRELLKGKCKKCLYKFICGGCRAMPYSLNKDYLAEDPSCFL